MLNDDLVKRENSLFLKRWLQEPRQLGTLAPISRKLALSACTFLKDPTGLNVVGIGAGTGRLARWGLNPGSKLKSLTMPSFGLFLKKYKWHFDNLSSRCQLIILKQLVN